METLALIEAPVCGLPPAFLRHSLELSERCADRIAARIPGARVCVVTDSPEFGALYENGHAGATCLVAHEYWLEEAPFLRAAACPETAALMDGADRVLVMPEAVAGHLDATLAQAQALWESRRPPLLLGVQKMQDNPCQYRSYRTLLDLNVLLPREQDHAVYAALNLDPGSHFVSVPLDCRHLEPPMGQGSLPGHAATLVAREGNQGRLALCLAQHPRLARAKALAFDNMLCPRAAVFNGGECDFMVHDLAARDLDPTLRLMLPHIQIHANHGSGLHQSTRDGLAGFVLPKNWRTGQPTPFILSMASENSPEDYVECVTAPGKYLFNRFTGQAHNLGKESAVHGRQDFPDVFSLENSLAMFPAQEADELKEHLFSGHALAFRHEPNDQLLGLLDRNAPRTGPRPDYGDPTSSSPVDMVFDQARATLKNHEAPLLFSLLKQLRDQESLATAHARQATGMTARHAGSFGNEHFTKPLAAMQLPGGNIAACDVITKELVLFDAQHAFLRKQRLDARTPHNFFTDQRGQVWLSDIGLGRIMRLSPSGRIVEQVDLAERLGGLSGHGNAMSGCVHDQELFLLLGAANPLDQIVAATDLGESGPRIIDTSTVKRGGSLVEHDSMLLLCDFDAPVIYALDEDNNRFDVWADNLPFDIRHLFTYNGMLFAASAHSIWVLEFNKEFTMLYDVRSFPETANASLSYLLFQGSDTLLCVDKIGTRIIKLSIEYSYKGGSQ